MANSLFQNKEFDNRNHKIYYILMKPDRDSFHAFEAFKIAADDFLGIEKFVYSYPHISLLQSMMHKKSEEQIISILEEFSADINDVRLVATGLVDFSNNTIVAALENQEFLLSLVNRMHEKMHMQGLFAGKKRPFKAENLHVTIAKNVPAAQFNSLKEYLLEMPFSKLDVRPGKLLLLMKTSPYQRYWNKVHEIDFSARIPNS